MLKAIVVDRDYGSVSPQELNQVGEAYARAGIQLECRHFTTEEEIIAGCGEAFAILCTGNPPITRRVLESLPNLRYIQRFGAGANSIDLDAAARTGKIVLYLPGFCARELADLSAAMILGLIRNTAYYDREIRRGRWPKCQYLLPGNVREMTLGLFGFGQAGRLLHDIFHNGFGTRVIACDPYISQEMKDAYPDVSFVDFDTLLRESDIISIHTILTPETTHVFDRDAFCRMKDSAMIINTSRGPVIDQKALAWALQEGQIRYAGLDTLEQEPIDPNDPLLGMDNVILNPHSGSYGSESKKTQIRMVCELIPTAVTEGRLSARCVADPAVQPMHPELQWC